MEVEEGSFGEFLSRPS